MSDLNEKRSLVNKIKDNVSRNVRKTVEGVALAGALLGVGHTAQAESTENTLPNAPTVTRNVDGSFTVERGSEKSNYDYAFLHSNKHLIALMEKDSLLVDDGYNSLKIGEISGFVTGKTMKTMTAEERREWGIRTTVEGSGAEDIFITRDKATGKANYYIYNDGESSLVKLPSSQQVSRYEKGSKKVDLIDEANNVSTFQVKDVGRLKVMTSKDNSQIFNASQMIMASKTHEK